MEAVRVAFKAGIAASTVGDELEYRTVPQESWSISISRDTGLSDNDALETLCAQIVSTAYVKVTTAVHMLRQILGDFRA